MSRRKNHYLLLNVKALFILLQESLFTFGGIDVLILNHFAPFLDFWDPTNWTLPKNPGETLEEQFKVNAVSYMKLATVFLPELQKSSGRIGVVSSLAAVLPIPRMAPYCACKAALHGFFNSLRMELIARKTNTSITINVLGGIATKAMLDNMHKVPDMKPEDLYPVDECAMTIVQAITKRKRLIFYPRYFKITQFMHLLFPETIEKGILKAQSLSE